MAARSYHVARTIAAPAEVVWALLTDASTYAEWNPTIVSIEGNMDQGSTLSLVSTVSPKRTFTVKVTELQAPRRMVWSDGMPLGLFRGVRTYELIPTGIGSTVFSMTEVFSGRLSVFITALIPDLSASFEQFGDGLKIASEHAVR